MAKEKFRIPATTWFLVMILDPIFRDHCDLEVFGEPCLTFENTAEWDEYLKDDDFGPSYTMGVYIGSGHLTAMGIGNDPGNGKRIDIRVRCERQEMVNASVSFWDIMVWLKMPDGSIQRRRFATDVEHGDSREFHEEDIRDMPENPPKRFAFWRK